VNHLGARVSALVDGQLRHTERDRALAHVAHCATCREAVDAERSVKTLLSGTPVPALSADLLASLHGLGEPGGPVSPRPRAMPLGPVVPTLPPPGRGPFGSRSDSRRPAKGRRTQRVRYAAAGAVSVAGLVLGTAFAAGGAGAGAAAVVPPAAELSVEHAATTSGLPLGDPAFTAVTASFGGLTIVGTPPR
jgi:Putative zinc-finger